MQKKIEQTNTEDSLEIVKSAAVSAQERRAEITRILDLRQLDAFTNFFLICSGNSDRQVESISEKIVEDLRESWGTKPWRREGDKKSDWILIDYVDFVVHVFLEDVRQFYNLERLWSEAKQIDVPELELPPGHLLHEDGVDGDFDELADYNFDDFLVDDDF